MRTFTSVALVGAVATLALAGTATAAVAGHQSQIGVVKTATTSYMLPSTSSTLVHVNLAANTQVHVQCYAIGQEVYFSPVWLRVATSDKLGFVPAGNVHLMDPKVPAC